MRHILESKKEEKKQLTRATKAQGKRENNLYSTARIEETCSIEQGQG